jgi:alpha/beta superfamily hydrolase
MDVWLLSQIGVRLAAEGWAVLRYDVRGIGDSEAGSGSWDGDAERHDLAGAVDRVVDEVPPGAPVALVGWSFGALLGLLHGPTDPRVTDWIGIGAPTSPLDGVPMRVPDLGAVADWTARRVVIVGSHDQHFPPSTVDVLHPDEVHVVDDADHFLFDRDREVADLVARGLARHRRSEPGS